MKSPFAIFRKHQRVLIVALTGLAMFAFIFLGTISKMQSSAALLPLLLVMLGAGVFWILGTPSGKSNSYAATGALLGAAIGLLLPRLMTSNDAVLFVPTAGASADNLSDIELHNLKQRRITANNFVQAAYKKGTPYPTASESSDQMQFQMMRAQFWQQKLNSFVFNFGHNDLEEDVVFGYLLRQEAKQLGLVVSDNTVTEYIRQVSSGSNLQNGLSASDFHGLCRHMRLAASDLYDILRDELLARTAMQMLFPRNFETPEEIWEQHRKLTVTTELDVVPLPVEDFVGEIREPSDDDLLPFFEKYRDVFPGQADFGAPGFRQPRRIAIGYFEADYESVEAQVPEITDEEIQKYYDERKETVYRIKTIPEQESSDRTEAKETDTDDSDQSGDSATATDATKPTPEKNEPVKPAAEKAEKKATDDKPAEAKTDTAAPAEAKSADEKPAADKTKADGTAEKKEVPHYRPLDDDLKSEIRDQLLAERTFELMKTQIGKAKLEMQDVGRFYAAPADAPERITASEIDARMTAYAKKNKLRYRKTKPLSAQELQDSEDYPIGKATEPVNSQRNVGSAASVVQLLFGTDSEQLYLSQEAEDTITSSRFAFWPIQFVPEHVPKFEDEGIRDQVLKAWKLEQARPLAEKRAKELAEKVRSLKDGKTMGDALAEETVTGKEKAPAISIRSTPAFAWYTRTTSSAPQLNPFSPPRESVRLSTVAGVEQAGVEFMKAVFDAKPGDVTTALNEDKSICYVVKVKTRTPGDPEAEKEMRDQFLAEGGFSSQAQQFLASGQQQMTNMRWAQQLMMKYGVHWNRSRTEKGQRR